MITLVGHVIECWLFHVGRVLGTGRAVSLLHHAIDLRKKKHKPDWASFLLEIALPMKLREDMKGDPRKKVSVACGVKKHMELSEG